MDFTLVYNTDRGVQLITEGGSFTGNFAPASRVDKCTIFNGSHENFEAVQGVDVQVVGVTFDDGTLWTSGDGFTRAYAADGNKLAQAESVPENTPYIFPSVQAAATPPPPLKFAENFLDAGKAPVEVLSGTVWLHLPRRAGKDREHAGARCER